MKVVRFRHFDLKKNSLGLEAWGQYGVGFNDDDSDLNLNDSISIMY